MIDTHVHLYDQAFDDDRDATLQRAIAAGIDTFLLPAIDSHSLQRQETLADSAPIHCYEMMGLHPTSVQDDYEQELEVVRSKLFGKQRRYIAVGEIGLDLYWDTSRLDEQRDALRRQLQWAEELHLPVALHVRKAYNELFAILRDMNRSSYSGVLHCFGGSEQEACRAVEMGFYIGVGGVATFKNATLSRVAATMPLERIVLETDAPYLAPVPHRGRRNEPAYLPLVAQTIANMRNIPFEAVDEQTTINARTLFAL